MGRRFFQILGAVAEFEHALMPEWTADGLAAARARGRTAARNPNSARARSGSRDMYEETDEDGKRRYTVAQIAAEFGVTRPPSTVTSPEPPDNATADAVPPG